MERWRKDTEQFTAGTKKNKPYYQKNSEYANKDHFYNCLYHMQINFLSYNLSSAYISVCESD